MINNGIKTFIAGVALLALAERVRIKAGTTTSPPEVERAPVGATDSHIGYVEAPAALGEPVAIRPLNMDGTKEVVASAAFAVGAKLYGSANGRVSGTVSGNPIGVAVESSTAAGDIIEMTEL